jgi:hypothetical protein
MNVLFNKLIMYLLVLIYSIAGLAHSCHSSSNLALHKPYWVSAPPSYPLTAPQTDRTSLTDGVYTTGHFWTSRTTVGWHPIKTVEILLDLEKVSTIDGITFNTVRGQDAGVYYPVQIAAFVGPDKEHFLYVGDIADSSDNQPGPYRVKRFMLNEIGARGRYVLLEITAPKSNSIFCDEIEVLAGSRDRGMTGKLSVETARKLSERTKWLGSFRKCLNEIEKPDVSAISANQEQFARIKAIRRRWAEITSVDDVGAVEADISRLRADVLRTRYGERQLLIVPAKPWAPESPAAILSSPPLKDLTLSIPSNGYDCAAFLITNLSDKTRRVSLSFAKMSEGAPELSIFQVPFVKSAATEHVADPLVPVTDEFALDPGVSRLIFVEARGNTPGVWKAKLGIISNGTSAYLPVNCRVFSLALPGKLSLNSVNWGYLTFKLIRDRKEQAVMDLLAHHTSVVVVPPDYLPGANQTVTADLMDSIRLEEYLKAHQGASKLLLATGFGAENRTTVIGKHPFLSEQWKEGFRKWYTSAVLAAKRAGFNEGQLYLYPYDEMGGQQIDDFVRFAAWVKKDISTARLYATLGWSTLGSKGWQRVLPYLDIAQACDEGMLNSSGSRESWIYSADGPAKSLSPYTYYRLMSWKAFLRGYTGVGFWAYADADVNDNPDSSWDDANREARDFAVIYQGKGTTIISSRRWEAWRMGIEDYELLTMYAKAKGAKAAKDLAATVLNHPEDTSKADELRRKILTELSGMENN